VLARLFEVEEDEIRRLDIARLDCLIQGENDRIATPLEGV